MTDTNNRKLVPAAIFGDGMILQRDKNCRVFGKTEGDEVTVVLSKDGNEETFKAHVADGKFVCSLDPHEAGTGYELTIRSGDETVSYKDVCFGDVYYLSGQSNMELPVYRTLDVTGDEVNASDYPYVRQYLLSPIYRLDPSKEAELPENPWTKAQGDDLMQFSAVGFFGAKRLYDKLQVPIGLVHAAQGGASIEAWMPLDLLDGFGDFREKAKPFMADGTVQEFLKNQDISQAAWVDSLNDDLGKGMENEIPGDAEEINVPFIRSSQGDDRYFGSIWFYKEFEIDGSDMIDGDAFLYLGEMIDSDITYVNGTEAGTTGYCYPPRKYNFPAKILKPGKNLIAVRLVVEHGCAAFLPDHPYFISIGGKKIDLTGKWKTKNGTRTNIEKDPFFMAQWIPSSLYQSSVLPVRQFAMKGIWWYQGESNASDPARYDEKFKAMVLKFRETFGDELPVICTVMADYDDPANGKIGDIASGFSDDGLTIQEGWKTVQEMQLHAPEQVELCAAVSAKDLSEPFELHPQNKSILGARFAEKALDWI
ncbi:MAG: hypothetical protein IKW88_03975 [Clostridiales bacterium]|nr:hypothetical protein [Clostridiales bacterium]